MPLLLTPRYRVIYDRDTVMVTDPHGWIGEGRTGLFVQDTRCLSLYRLTLGGQPPRFLGADQPSATTLLLTYTNPRLGTPARPIPENSLLLTVHREIAEELREEIRIVNHSGHPRALTLVLTLDSDFADIFEVRGLERIPPRLAQVRWEPETATLHLHYRKGPFERRVCYRIQECPTRPIHGLGTLLFRLDLTPGAVWRCTTALTVATERPAPRVAFSPPGVASGTRLETLVQPVAACYRQAVADLVSLRLIEGPEGWIPSAGIPWYATLFGRDALITAYQCLTLDPRIAWAVLTHLAALQGRRVDDWTDEEPGRIPHELRRGELATLGRIPHRPLYYGTVDAPFLYVILLHEAYRFTGDRALLERFYPTAAACLAWARQYGDRDGDGLVEYQTRSPRGYRHQGWKDSGDAVVYPDGRPVDPPIALCEVQGYYYDALRRLAQIADWLGRPAEAHDYRQRARALAEHVNEHFWLPDEETYAFGLDAQKRPIASVVSNAGHLLWSGIVPPARAARLARRLLAPDLFSGWGLRTLSCQHPAYSPVSYHRGSVWPHENALIALGLKRYGYWREALRIVEGIFDAAWRYERFSLPELFAGVAREPGAIPVPYVEANRPQAWAAGSILLLLRVILGLEPDPARQTLVVAPTLPAWLPAFTLEGLALFGRTVRLSAVGEGLASRVEVAGDVWLEQRPPDQSWDPLEVG